MSHPAGLFAPEKNISSANFGHALFGKHALLEFLYLISKTEVIIFSQGWLFRYHQVLLIEMMKSNNKHFIDFMDLNNFLFDQVSGKKAKDLKRVWGEDALENNRLQKWCEKQLFQLSDRCFFPGSISHVKVLGLKKKIYFLNVILPQMLRLAIPNLSNVWQLTLKDTALISVTGLVEIMRQSYIAAGSTRDPLFFYSFAALLYLILTFISMKFINKIEKKYNKGF